MPKDRRIRIFAVVRWDMDKELTLVLRTLKQKTGISVDVYSADFKFLYSGGERIQFTYDGGYTEGLCDMVTLLRD